MTSYKSRALTSSSHGATTAKLASTNEALKLADKYLSETSSSKHLRGRFEVPQLMPRSSRSSLGPRSPYTPRHTRSASGPRVMAGHSSTGRSTYGSSGYGSSSTSNYGSSYTPSSSYLSGSSTGNYGNYNTSSTSGLYTSPRTGTSTYTSGAYGSSGSSYYTPSTSTSSYSSSYTPSHRSSSYYTPTSPPDRTSPGRSKSPVKEGKEEFAKEPTATDSSTEEHSAASRALRRFRNRDASKVDEDSEEPTVPLPSMSENGAAATMSKDLRECLREEFLLCKICFDVFKEPKSLPCLHTFCLECLNKYMEGYRLDFRKFSCPICRRQVYMPKEGAEGFPDSFFVERLRDVLSRRTDDTDCYICNFKGTPTPAKLFCLECKANLCNECGSGHRDNKVTAKHSLLALAEDASVEKGRQHCCETHHGEPVCFFCTQCRGPICLVCTVTDHSGHEIEAIQEVRQEFLKECQSYIDKAEVQLNDLTGKRDKLGNVEQEVCDKKESVKVELCSIADNLIAEINKQKTALLTELDQLFDFQTIETERKRLDSTINHLQTAVEGGKTILSKDLEPIEQLKAKGQILMDLDEALHFEPYNVDVFSDRSQLAVQLLSGESEVRLGRLVRTVLPSEGSNADPIIEYKAADNGDNLINTTGGAQTFIVKEDIRRQLRAIDGLALLPNGDLVVLSANSEKRIQIFDMNGMLKTYFPQRSVKLQQPTAMCVCYHADGPQIAVTDLATHSVHVFDTQGRLDHVFGAGVLDRPWAITSTPGGNFVIADPGKTRLTIHTNQGDLLNVVHFQKKGCTPRFLATCGNTIYSVGQFGDDIRAWRFVDFNLRILGVIKVSSAAGAGGSSNLAPSQSLVNIAMPPQPSPATPQTVPNAVTKQEKMTTSSVSSQPDADDATPQRSRSGSVSVGGASSPAPFACAGLFADKEGNLFVTDRSTSSVAVFTALSETYMIQLTPVGSPSRPSAIVVTPDDRVIVAQSKADETISGLVEAITGDALNMELVSYTLC